MARTAQNSTHLPIEQYVNAVELQGGLYTNYPVVINNSLTVDGAIKNAQANVSSLTSATTLTVADSGTTYLLDSASGVTVTLPTAQAGLVYKFIVQTSVTSNSYKITAGSSNGFLIGGITEATAGGAADVFTGDGATDISVTMNGTTTGGLLGTVITIACVTTGLWEVGGVNIASGTIATPFATT